MTHRLPRNDAAPEKTLLKGGVAHQYRPLALKALIAGHGVSVGQLALHVKQPSGLPLSRSAMQFLLNYDVWPKYTSAASIKEQVESYLASRGVPAALLAGAWAVDEQLQQRTNRRYELSARAPRTKAREEASDDDQPDIPEKEMLSAAARKHFQIFRDPFIDEIRGPEDIYMSADQRYIREAMYQTAKNGGFIAVIGESGAGKTTLRLDLIERVNRDGLPIHFIQPRVIDKSRLTARMVCEAILGDLAPNEVPPNSLERLTRKVERVLLESYKAGNRHVLLIEESQDLEPRALKHLKRFYELQAGYVKLLSVILVGQPELRNLLDERQHFDLREVIRRCEVAELQPLDGNVREYLALKFDRVGKQIEDVFTTDAFEAIVSRLTRDSSRGKVSMVYPLVVNNITTKAMNLAASMGEQKISAEVVREV
jgi:type II secretory pathway predicted ATPase ExeA